MRSPAPLRQYSASSGFFVDELEVGASIQIMSEFTLSSFSAAGTGSIDIELDMAEPAPGSALARASIGFSSTNPIPYDLSVMFTSNIPLFSGARVQILSGGGGAALDILSQEMVQESGVLPAGDSTLVVRAFTGGAFPSALHRSLSYEFSFVVPAPGGAAAFAALAVWGSRRRRN